MSRSRNMGEVDKRENATAVYNPYFDKNFQKKYRRLKNACFNLQKNGRKPALKNGFRGRNTLSPPQDSYLTKNVWKEMETAIKKEQTIISQSLPEAVKRVAENNTRPQHQSQTVKFPDLFAKCNTNQNDYTRKQIMTDGKVDGRLPICTATAYGRAHVTSKEAPESDSCRIPFPSVFKLATQGRPLYDMQASLNSMRNHFYSSCYRSSIKRDGNGNNKTQISIQPDKSKRCQFGSNGKYEADNRISDDQSHDNLLNSKLKQYRFPFADTFTNEAADADDYDDEFGDFCSDGELNINKTIHTGSRDSRVLIEIGKESCTPPGKREMKRRGQRNSLPPSLQGAKSVLRCSSRASTKKKPWRCSVLKTFQRHRPSFITSSTDDAADADNDYDDEADAEYCDNVNKDSGQHANIKRSAKSIFVGTKGVDSTVEAETQEGSCTRLRKKQVKRIGHRNSLQSSLQRMESNRASDERKPWWDSASLTISPTASVGQSNEDAKNIHVRNCCRGLLSKMISSGIIIDDLGCMPFVDKEGFAIQNKSNSASMTPESSGSYHGDQSSQSDALEESPSSKPPPFIKCMLSPPQPDCSNEVKVSDTHDRGKQSNELKKDTTQNLKVNEHFLNSRQDCSELKKYWQRYNPYLDGIGEVYLSKLDKTSRKDHLENGGLTKWNKSDVSDDNSDRVQIFVNKHNEESKTANNDNKSYKIISAKDVLKNRPFVQYTSQDFQQRSGLSHAHFKSTLENFCTKVEGKEKRPKSIDVYNHFSSDLNEGRENFLNSGTLLVDQSLRETLRLAVDFETSNDTKKFKDDKDSMQNKANPNLGGATAESDHPGNIFSGNTSNHICQNFMDLSSYASSKEKNSVSIQNIAITRGDKNNHAFGNKSSADKTQNGKTLETDEKTNACLSKHVQTLHNSHFADQQTRVHFEETEEKKRLFLNQRKVENNAYEDGLNGLTVCKTDYSDSVADTSSVTLSCCGGTETEETGETTHSAATSDLSSESESDLSSTYDDISTRDMSSLDRDDHPSERSTAPSKSSHIDFPARTITSALTGNCSKFTRNAETLRKEYECLKSGHRSEGTTRKLNDCNSSNTSFVMDRGVNEKNITTYEIATSAGSLPKHNSSSEILEESAKLKSTKEIICPSPCVGVHVKEENRKGKMAVDEQKKTPLEEYQNVRKSLETATHNKTKIPPKCKDAKHLHTTGDELQARYSPAFSRNGLKQTDTVVGGNTECQNPKLCEVSCLPDSCGIYIEAQKKSSPSNIKGEAVHTLKDEKCDNDLSDCFKRKCTDPETSKSRREEDTSDIHSESNRKTGSESSVDGNKGVQQLIMSSSQISAGNGQTSLVVPCNTPCEVSATTSHLSCSFIKMRDHTGMTDPFEVRKYETVENQNVVHSGTCFKADATSFSRMNYLNVDEILTKPPYSKAPKTNESSFNPNYYRSGPLIVPYFIAAAAPKKSPYTMQTKNAKKNDRPVQESAYELGVHVSGSKIKFMPKPKAFFRTVSIPHKTQKRVSTIQPQKESKDIRTNTFQTNMIKNASGKNDSDVKNRATVKDNNLEHDVYREKSVAWNVKSPYLKKTINYLPRTSTLNSKTVPDSALKNMKQSNSMQICKRGNESNDLDSKNVLTRGIPANNTKQTLSPFHLKPRINNAPPQAIKPVKAACKNIKKCPHAIENNERGLETNTEKVSSTVLTLKDKCTFYPICKSTPNILKSNNVASYRHRLPNHTLSQTCGIEKQISHGLPNINKNNCNKTRECHSLRAVSRQQLNTNEKAMKLYHDDGIDINLLSKNKVLLLLGEKLEKIEKIPNKPTGEHAQRRVKMCHFHSVKGVSFQIPLTSAKEGNGNYIVRALDIDKYNSGSLKNRRNQYEPHKSFGTERGSSEQNYDKFAPIQSIDKFTHILYPEKIVNEKGSKSLFQSQYGENCKDLSVNGDKGGRPDAISLDFKSTGNNTELIERSYDAFSETGRNYKDLSYRQNFKDECAFNSSNNALVDDKSDTFTPEFSFSNIEEGNIQDMTSIQERTLGKEKFEEDLNSCTAHADSAPHTPSSQLFTADCESKNSDTGTSNIVGVGICDTLCPPPRVNLSSPQVVDVLDSTCYHSDYDESKNERRHVESCTETDCQRLNDAHTTASISGDSAEHHVVPVYIDTLKEDEQQSLQKEQHKEQDVSNFSVLKKAVGDSSDFENEINEYNSEPNKSENSVNADEIKCEKVLDEFTKDTLKRQNIKSDPFKWSHSVIPIQQNSDAVSNTGSQLALSYAFLKAKALQKIQPIKAKMEVYTQPSVLESKKLITSVVEKAKDDLSRYMDHFLCGQYPDFSVLERETAQIRESENMKNVQESEQNDPIVVKTERNDGEQVNASEKHSSDNVSSKQNRFMEKDMNNSMKKNFGEINDSDSFLTSIQNCVGDSSKSDFLATKDDKNNFFDTAMPITSFEDRNTMPARSARRRRHRNSRIPVRIFHTRHSGTAEVASKRSENGSEIRNNFPAKFNVIMKGKMYLDVPERKIEYQRQMEVLPPFTKKAQDDQDPTATKLVSSAAVNNTMTKKVCSENPANLIASPDNIVDGSNEEVTKENDKNPSQMEMQLSQQASTFPARNRIIQAKSRLQKKPSSKSEQTTLSNTNILKSMDQEMKSPTNRQQKCQNMAKNRNDPRSPNKSINAKSIRIKSSCTYNELSANRHEGNTNVALNNLGCEGQANQNSECLPRKNQNLDTREERKHLQNQRPGQKRLATMARNIKDAATKSKKNPVGQKKNLGKQNLRKCTESKKIRASTESKYRRLSRPSQPPSPATLEQSGFLARCELISSDSSRSNISGNVKRTQEIPCSKEDPGQPRFSAPETPILCNRICNRIETAESELASLMHSEKIKTENYCTQSQTHLSDPARTNFFKQAIETYLYGAPLQKINGDIHNHREREFGRESHNSIDEYESKYCHKIKSHSLSLGPNPSLAKPSTQSVQTSTLVSEQSKIKEERLPKTDQKFCSNKDAKEAKLSCCRNASLDPLRQNSPRGFASASPPDPFKKCKSTGSIRRSTKQPDIPRLTSSPLKCLRERTVRPKGVPFDRFALTSGESADASQQRYSECISPDQVSHREDGDVVSKSRSFEKTPGERHTSNGKCCDANERTYVFPKANMSNPAENQSEHDNKKVRLRDLSRKRMVNESSIKSEASEPPIHDSSDKTYTINSVIDITTSTSPELNQNGDVSFSIHNPSAEPKAMPSLHSSTLHQLCQQRLAGQDCSYTTLQQPTRTSADATMKNIPVLINEMASDYLIPNVSSSLRTQCDMSFRDSTYVNSGVNISQNKPFKKLGNEPINDESSRNEYRTLTVPREATRKNLEQRKRLQRVTTEMSRTPRKGSITLIGLNSSASDAVGSSGFDHHAQDPSILLSSEDWHCNNDFQVNSNPCVGVNVAKGAPLPRTISKCTASYSSICSTDDEAAPKYSHKVFFSAYKDDGSKIVQVREEGGKVKKNKADEEEQEGKEVNEIGSCLSKQQKVVIGKEKEHNNKSLVHNDTFQNPKDDTDVCRNMKGSENKSQQQSLTTSDFARASKTYHFEPDKSGRARETMTKTPPSTRKRFCMSGPERSYHTAFEPNKNGKTKTNINGDMSSRGASKSSAKASNLTDFEPKNADRAEANKSPISPTPDRSRRKSSIQNPCERGEKCISQRNIHAQSMSRSRSVASPGYNRNRGEPIKKGSARKSINGNISPRATSQSSPRSNPLDRKSCERKRNSETSVSRNTPARDMPGSRSLSTCAHILPPLSTRQAGLPHRQKVRRHY
ncbi:hypothetical protein PoB_003243000 [Plakobranchus ocellatus]|uniref:Uncharacterized protein n=1 Tax=Plakobranchus ocellatus TaxID=259542 RepID=A0AAV4AGN4_9GAST|nr:hypothetical protein PoB_003243000 [Plakobranchus ocellatus]